MGDMGDIFKALKEDRKIKKDSNRVSSTQILEDHGIEFESKNHGVHLIITCDTGKIDFWPSTGKWTPRGERSGRGISKLIVYVASKLKVE